MKAVAALFLIGASLSAGTVVISQGATPGSFSQPMNGPDGYTGYVDAGFTTGNTGYSNVEIDATLEGNDLSGDSVDAYLTTSVGINSTSPAYATATGIAVSSGSYSSVALFTGLSLAANTSYYLTIAPDGSDEVYWGVDNSQPAPVTDAGVSIIAATFCTNDDDGCAPFPPATDDFDPNSGAYYPLGANPIFSVTAQSSSAPEPSTGLLFAAGVGLVAFGIRSRRRS